MKKVLILFTLLLIIGCSSPFSKGEDINKSKSYSDSVLHLISNLNSMYSNALLGLKKKHIDDSLQVLNYEKYYGIVYDENERYQDTIEQLRDFIDSHTVFHK